MFLMFGQHRQATQPLRNMRWNDPEMRDRARELDEVYAKLRRERVEAFERLPWWRRAITTPS